MCEVYVCQCRGLYLAIEQKGISVILWFFFWLYNSHLTAEIVQGRIRDSRHKIWLLDHPRSLSICLLFVVCQPLSSELKPRTPVSSFIQSKEPLVPHFSPCSLPVLSVPPLCLWWLRCKTQVGQTRPVSHTWTNPWHKHCSWRQDFPLHSLSNYEDNCFRCCRALFWPRVYCHS